MIAYEIQAVIKETINDVVEGTVGKVLIKYDSTISFSFRNPNTNKLTKVPVVLSNLIGIRPKKLVLDRELYNRIVSLYSQYKVFYDDLYSVTQEVIKLKKLNGLKVKNTFFKVK